MIINCDISALNDSGLVFDNLGFIMYVCNKHFNTAKSVSVSPFRLIMGGEAVKEVYLLLWS